jgi:hypothetical protein
MTPGRSRNPASMRTRTPACGATARCRSRCSVWRRVWWGWGRMGCRRSRAACRCRRCLARQRVFTTLDDDSFTLPPHRTQLFSARGEQLCAPSPGFSVGGGCALLHTHPKPPRCTGPPIHSLLVHAPLPPPHTAALAPSSSGCSNPHLCRAWWVPPCRSALHGLTAPAPERRDRHGRAVSQGGRVVHHTPTAHTTRLVQVKHSTPVVRTVGLAWGGSA